jgi:phosphatidylglycerophosphate synthase
MPEFNKAKRAFYERAFLGIGRIFYRMGLRPNFFTAVSFVCGILSGIYFWQADITWGIFWMLMNALMDILDGSTARAGKIETVFGGILDHVSDRFGEFFILAGITLSGLIHPFWGLFAFFGMLSASYTRAAAESIGRIENCAVGIMGRTEKYILIIIGAILAHHYPAIQWLGINLMETTLIIVGLTSYITTVQRLFYAARVLKGKRWEDR